MIDAFELVKLLVPDDVATEIRFYESRLLEHVRASYPPGPVLNLHAAAALVWCIGQIAELRTARRAGALENTRFGG